MRVVTEAQLSEDLVLIAVGTSRVPYGGDNITSSELGVLQLVAQGLSNAAIARLRGTSVRTVANQLAASYRKLRVSGRRELRARWGHARYLLAYRNAPKLGRDRRLTGREQQVVTYADLGHPNKLIAYTLGVSLSTVSTLLTRARRKLGHDISVLHGRGAPGEG